MKLALAALALCMALTACGQKGALFLPTQDETPVSEQSESS